MLSPESCGQFLACQVFDPTADLYEDTNQNRDRDLDLCGDFSGIGRQVLTAVAPVIFTLGSFAAGFYLSSLVEKVIDYFQEEDDDYSDAMIRLFADPEADNKVNDLVTPLVMDVLPKPPAILTEIAYEVGAWIVEFITSVGNTLKTEFFDLVGIAAEVKRSLSDGILVALRNKVQEWPEIKYGSQLLLEEDPNMSFETFRRRMRAKDWPKGEFQIYCDGFKQLFGQGDDDLLVSGQSNVDLFVSGQSTIELLTTTTGGESENSAIQNVEAVKLEEPKDLAPLALDPCRVKDRVVFFEQIGYITAVNRDRARALAAMSSAQKKTHAQTVADWIQAAMEDEDEGIINEGGRKESNGSSTDSDEADSDGFYIVSKRYTTLERISDS